MRKIKLPSPKVVSFTFICILGLASAGANAWTKKGHDWMLLQSMLTLQPKQQEYYSKLFSSIGPANSFASLPDSKRDSPLKAIYAEFKQTLPKSLEKYGDETTSAWHYHNNVMSTEETRKCQFKNEGKLIEVMTALDKALKEDLKEKQRAVTLSFFTHLLQDIHQPLHTFTKLDSKCKHDRGGNGVCVVKEGKKCKQNLHQLWDQGFDVFDGGVKLPKVEQKAYVFSPNAWAYESTRYYHSAYDLKNKAYDSSSQKIVAKQVAAAIARLSAHLKQHYALYNQQTPLLKK